MFFSIVMWSSYNESIGNMRAVLNNVENLSFSTGLPGGFTDCDFSLGEEYQVILGQWYKDIIGHHVVILDFLGRRVWEGYVSSSNISARGIEVRCVGYYAHAQDLTHGILYPISTPTSASDIVIDTIDLSDKWWQVYDGVTSLSMDITPQDFTGDAKLGDAIERVCSYGNDAASPSAMFFAIWEFRKPFFSPLPNPLTSLPNWSVGYANFIDMAGVSLSRSRDLLFNKIQVLYDDPDVGQTFTNWFEDTISQGIYGVREGTLNIGESLPGIADVVAELALARYAYPVQKLSFGVRGQIFAGVGSGVDYPYMIRAGQLVRVLDLDPDVVKQMFGVGGTDVGQVVIRGTRYSAESNTTELEFGESESKFDILLARIGMSNAGVR